MGEGLGFNWATCGGFEVIGVEFEGSLMDIGNQLDLLCLIRGYDSG